MGIEPGHRLLTVKELADFLTVKADRIYELVSSKKLQARKVGRLLRFTEEDIRDFLDRNATR